ncbi:MAG: BirA family biotin operon repressor/biotin-[acetyl-CoA-carboxylase] ligase [Planctomycetota bacterium]
MKLRAIQHGQVDSTQARAFAAITDGSARDGDVHVAEGQSAGLGRRGRSWFSPPTGGLYASVILLQDGPPKAPGAWTAAGSLALLDTLVPAGASSVHLKWPNDLVTPAGAKLGGVLAEARSVAGRPVMVLGMGLNVGRMGFPAELEQERPVIDLAGLGVDTSPQALLGPLLVALGARLEQARGKARSLSVDFGAALALGSGALRIETQSGVHEGQITALDLAGELALMATDGALVRVPVEHVTSIARIR